MKKLLLTLVVLSFVISYVNAQYRVKTFDLLGNYRMRTNAAGPVLLAVDEMQNKIYVANTLSSSISIIDGRSNRVENFPIGGRALQHLKSTAMTFDSRAGLIFMIGTKNFSVLDYRRRTFKTFKTDKQFECITVDEKSGNAFLTGRESSKIGFYNGKTMAYDTLSWLEHEEGLVNLNQTPPPAIRKIIALNDKKQTVVAIDGFTSTMYLMNGSTGTILSNRKLALGNNDGRWHLAGFDANSGYLYIATETKGRAITDVAKIDVNGDKDTVIQLPEGFTEPVGICYNSKLQEVYIPYDNHAFVHVVDFKNNGKISSIPIPTFGNDGSAIDIKNDLLYLASWAHGEVEVIDLKARKFVKKISDLGIIPHMFAFVFNPANNSLYYPVGASAVNGAFGASVTKLDPMVDTTYTIRTGWSPIDIIDLPNRNAVLVFNNEDQFCEIKYSGNLKTYQLPVRFPIVSAYSPNGNIYLSYGPHQSYWPVVYIWGAKNGILNIDKENLSFYDRRIPRQAMNMALGKDGILYLQQNNWGAEPIIINKIEDEVRYYEIGRRITIEDTVQRETSQRALKYDEKENRLYLLKNAEKDEDPSVVHIINPDSNKVIKSVKVESVATALEFDDKYIYTANFGSNSVSMIDKKTYQVFNVKAGKSPLRLAKCAGKVYVLNHNSSDIMEVRIPEVNRTNLTMKIPLEGKPDNFFNWNNKLITTFFNNDTLYITEINPEMKEFSVVQKINYTYGQTGLDDGNAAFYVKGCYGDVVPSLTKGIIDSKGSLWITDFLAGRVYLIEK
ncbi:hypothetical protein D9V86_00420 [Bacteroidetes/Chlorobi group bacterium ChocPot_Mid]|nr:MAG: hypothetical protein D9V86_00420 [Bacteroidetes/Chlorobi group bacterium ChocPot_Mid]